MSFSRSRSADDLSALGERKFFLRNIPQGWIAVSSKSYNFHMISIFRAISTTFSANSDKYNKPGSWRTREPGWFFVLLMVLLGCWEHGVAISGQRTQTFSLN